MEINRLTELRKNAPRDVEMKDLSKKDKEDKKPSSGTNPLTAHMKQFDEIKHGLEVIRKNTDVVNQLKEKERTIVQEKARKEIMAELDKVMATTSATGAALKTKLDKIKQEDDIFKAKKENMNSASTQMRINMYQTHVRRFHQVMNEFNQASQDFKNALKDRTRRQLKIIKADIDEEKVEEIVEAGHAEEVIAQALQEDMISEDLDAVVAQIEERHQGIMKLEQQVMQIYELFRDMATLVDQQQETLDVIETRIQSAKDFTEKAVEDLKKGEMFAKKGKKKQCCILAIVVGVLIAVIAPIVFSTSANF